MKIVIERLRTVYVALRSRLLLFYYTKICSGVSAGKRVRMYGKTLIHGPGKIVVGGGRRLQAGDR